MTKTRDLADLGGGFIQAGTGAVQRTVESKLQDVVSVKDFGAVGDNVTDDTAAIQAAITAATGKAVYFPAGVYKVTSTFQVNNEGATLYGDGVGKVFIQQYTPDIDTFVIRPTTAGITSAFLNNITIDGLRVSYQTVSTQGAGFRFVQVNTYKLTRCTVNNAPEGVTIMGGQFGVLDKISIFSSNGMTPDANTALLHFKQAPVGAGYEPCFTVEVSNFAISANKKRESCIKISNADGLHFSNGYVAFGDNSLVNVKAERDNSYVGAVGFTNVYLDCVSASGTLYGISIPDDGFTNTNVFGFSVGSGCFIGNCLQTGGAAVVVRKANTKDLSFNSVELANSNTWGIDFEGGSNGVLSIANCRFSTIGSVATGAIRVSDGLTLTVSGNAFKFITGVCTYLSGTWGSATFSGNNNNSTAADLDYSTATITNTLTTSGNTGAYTSATNNWRGVRTGNIEVQDLTALDWYLEGSFTPTITFGGASVGVTYTTNLGKYTRIGNRVLFNAIVILSNKGSSTGAVRITGLPFTANVSYNAPCAFKFSNVANNLGTTTVFAEVVGNTTEVKFQNLDTAGGVEFVVDVTDADITNTTLININGSYVI